MEIILGSLNNLNKVKFLQINEFELDVSKLMLSIGKYSKYLIKLFHRWPELIGPYERNRKWDSKVMNSGWIILCMKEDTEIQKADSNYNKIPWPRWNTDQRINIYVYKLR